MCEIQKKGVVAVSANRSWALSNYRMGLLDALHANGYSVVALVPQDEGVGKLTAAGIQVCPIPISGHGISPAAELVLLGRYIIRLRRLRPVAFLGFTIKPNIYGGIAGVLTGIPVINNITGLGIVFAKRGLLRWVVERLCRFAYRRSQRVFFQNRESLELFRSLKFVRDDQAALLPGSGIDLQRFHPLPKPAGDGDGFTFLVAARLLREKGIGEYAEAARWFRDNRPGIRFRLLGIFEPPSNKSAVSRWQVEEWEAEGLIEYLGSTDDIRPYFAAADCIVLPSYYPEGVPRALIEAAAMGIPAITTDTPGCRDAVDSGETGYLCEPGSTESLVRAMVRMVDLSPAQHKEMGARARRKAEDEFDERKVIELYLAELAASGST